MQLTDLLRFLHARLDDDERVARAASHPDQDRLHDHPGGPVGAPESWEWVETQSRRPVPVKGSAGFQPRQGAAGGHQWIWFAGHSHWVHSAVPAADGSLTLQSDNAYMLRTRFAFEPHPVLTTTQITFGAAAHIAAHDPARVLAEVAAKRRIVDAYQTAVARQDSAAAQTLEAVLRLLALPYAGHPDYDARWRP